MFRTVISDVTEINVSDRDIGRFCYGTCNITSPEVGELTPNRDEGGHTGNMVREKLVGLIVS